MFSNGIRYGLLGLLVVILLADPTAIPLLIENIKKAYTAFVYALSAGWI